MSEQPPRPQDRPLERHRRLLAALTVAMLASWLLMMAPLPFALGSGLTGLAALVLLVLLSIEAFRRRRVALGVLGLVVGVPATLLIIAGAAISALFYQPLAELEACRAEAITEQARAACTAEGQDAMVSWVSSVVGG
ncbi:hypothetical protein V1260_13980 [Brachybacterium sp. J144]|uniref:hypothetical protein n=1 Tax=Brachybacterium sp. J144 TaxID=3116487 RepID=UPI002E7A2CE6|nr:hypothetical protein [Brachybacterium sp. J144]MEE1651886.1 hypothetical protein [Brachybacterium sp. J144]